MKSDKYRKEFIEFDIQICDELMERSKQIPEQLGREETIDYKSGLIAGYMLGVGEGKSAVYKWLKYLDIVDTSNYHDEFEKMKENST